MTGDLLLILDKDEAAVNDLQQEIAHSRKIMELPPAERAAYYDANVIPLRRDEFRLAAEEKAVAARLRAKGVKVPWY